jgi:hypothetical protein
MVRLPLDHYEHYARQAAELNVPIGDLVAYKMAVIEGLEIPEQVLMAQPVLLVLLPEDKRAQTLARIPGLSARYRAVVGAEPLPGLSTVGTAGEDVTQAA